MTTPIREPSWPPRADEPYVSSHTGPGDSPTVPISPAVGAWHPSGYPPPGPPGRRGRLGGRAGTALLFAAGALTGVLAVLLVLGAVEALALVGGQPSTARPPTTGTAVSRTPTAAPTPTATATVVAAAIAPGVSGTVATTGPAVDLTAEGTGDWAHWGLDGAGSFDHKATGGGQISTYRVVGHGGAHGYGTSPTAYSWSDGKPTSSAQGTSTGVFVLGGGNGFTLSVPADDTTRVVTIYVGVFQAQGQLTARLNGGDEDGTAVFADASVDNQGGTTNAAYTLTYRGTDSGQRLTITFTARKVYGLLGNVSLQAATLRVAR